MRTLLVLGLLTGVLACDAPKSLVEGALTAVIPATSEPTGTPPPPTATPLPPTATPIPPTPVPVDVVIQEVVNAGYAEHVVIKNQDAIAADLTGWQLAEKDKAILPFVFPAGFKLAPGAEVRIFSGRDGRQNNPPESFDWTELNIWDNDGDTATLLNSIGKVVSTLKYP